MVNLHSSESITVRCVIDGAWYLSSPSLSLILMLLSWSWWMTSHQQNVRNSEQNGQHWSNYPSPGSASSHLQHQWDLFTAFVSTGSRPSCYEIATVRNHWCKAISPLRLFLEICCLSWCWLMYTIYRNHIHVTVWRKKLHNADRHCGGGQWGQWDRGGRPWSVSAPHLSVVGSQWVILTLIANRDPSWGLNLIWFLMILIWKDN